MKIFITTGQVFDISDFEISRVDCSYLLQII